MSAFLSDADLKTALAARLKLSGTSNMTTDSPHWDVLIAQCNQQAYDEIFTVLLERGYTTANINGWDRRVEFNRKIAVCMLLDEGGITDLAAEIIERACKCREELKTISIMVSGAIVDPSTGLGSVGHGDMDLDEETHRFVRDTEHRYEQDW